MPQLAGPGYLLLALLIPPLLWWWLRQRRAALRHPLAHLLARLPGRRGSLARVGGAVLRGLALLLLVTALARPRWPDLKTPLAPEGIALMMAVDVSGSMAERDFDWNGTPVSRLEAVQRVFRLFLLGGSAEELPADLAGGAGVRLEGRPTDLVGLVTFATRPETTCPLTLGHRALLRLLDAEEPRGSAGEGTTNLSDALAIGLHRLRAAGPRRKVLVLLTDGEHNQASPPSGWTPRQAAQVARQLGVPVYAIDAGPPSGSPPAPGRSSGSSAEQREQAERTLRELAQLTEGRYFSARDTKALLEACQAIDRLERAPIRSFQYRRYHEGYPWFGLAALALFCLAQALDLTFWRRLP